jgi:uncharacterized protein
MRMYDIDRLKTTVRRRTQGYHATGHDLSHALRVLAICNTIGEELDADLEVLGAAALLHDLGRARKGKQKRHHSMESVKIARRILNSAGFPTQKIPLVLHAIQVHSFEDHTAPKTAEAAILQDADRIDICGAIGAAMTFAYGGSHGSELYNPADPTGTNRRFDDHKYSFDHFFTKLLGLPEVLNTAAGRRIARRRRAHLKNFVAQFEQELNEFAQQDSA